MTHNVIIFIYSEFICCVFLKYVSIAWIGA